MAFRSRPVRANSFAEKLRLWHVTLRQAVGTKKAGIAIRLYNILTAEPGRPGATRRDTGRAAYGWAIQPDRQGSHSPPEGRYPSPRSAQHWIGQSLSRRRKPEGPTRWVVYNRVFYIKYLNDGTLHFPGDHMIEVAIARVGR